jgi:hypothetical protein
MALVTEDAPEEELAAVEPLRPRPARKSYQDNVINTKEVDHSSLLTFISGSSWTVNYYSQVLGTDQVGIAQQTDQSNVYQQYKEIIGLELKVQSVLSQDQDPETKLFEVIGTSNIYPSVKPNNGDMVIADVGDGRSAIFTLTSSRRLSIYEESGYEISYKLINYSTEELVTDLRSKVVETTYFNKEGLRNGSEAFLTKEDTIQLESVQSLLKSLTGAYTRRYWDKEFSTLLIENGMGDRIYDHFVLSFLKKLALPWTKQPDGLNCNGIEFFDIPTIWDTLLTGNQDYVDNSEYMNEVRTSSLSQFPALGGLAWSTIELARVPMIGKLPTLPIPETPSTVSHHPSTLDGHYVLSSWYYNNQKNGMSNLERYLMMWFEGKSLETTDIINIAKEVHTWDDVSQFYQTPIILTLLLSLER